jgi:TolB-like protein/DNA-binding winged helix-turn-helix (wHTH) protein/Tfp pilus assembly protein PilF
MAPSPSQVCFDSFKVDLRSGDVWKGDVRLRLQGQPFQVLRMLLEHRGEIVTRDELRQRLWPADTFVDFDDGLNTAVKKIRDLLGDSAERPRYIETIPRRGYRFMGAVKVSHAGAAAATPPLPFPWRRTTWLAATLAIVIAAVAIGGWRLRSQPRPEPVAIRAIAVLPLENLSGDPDQEYFSDGMTDALITNLAKIDSLRVISRTSVMRYKGTKLPLPQIARDLRVDAVLEGTVVRVGDRVRVTAQLIHAANDQHFWAESYERDLRDVLALQNEVAQAIAAQIHAKVMQPQRQYASARNVDPEAYEHYLKGRYSYPCSSKKGYNTAIRYFELAIEKEPDYAAAYAALAHCYMAASFGGQEMSPREAWPKAAAAAKKALELDDQLGEAHVAMAVIHFRFDWNWSEAEREYRRGLELSPNDASGLTSYAWFLGAMGRPEEALVQLARARELDPFSLPVSNAMASVYAWSRRWDEAIAESGRTLQLDANYVPAHNVLASSYEAKGMYEKAVNEELRIHLLTGHRPEQAESLQRAFATSGIKGFWEKSLEWEKREREHPRYFILARLCVRLGRTDEAFHWLEKAYEERYPNMPNMKVAAVWLDPVRSDPRYADLLRRVGLPP